MSLVKAKCPTCDGILDVNPEAEALVCKFCGSPFVVEKAIKHYTAGSGEASKNISLSKDAKQEAAAVDPLVARGLNLLNPTRVKEKNNELTPDQFELKDISSRLLAKDSNDFYGRLFLIDADDYSIKNYEICEKTPKKDEQKKFVDYLVQIIEWDIGFVDTISDDILHLQIQRANSLRLPHSLSSLKNMADNNSYAKEKFDKLLPKIKNDTLTIIDHACNNFGTFFFSKETVESYEFQCLEELVVNLNLFITFIEPVIDDITPIRKACERIFNAATSNKTTIMQYSPIYGKLLLETVYKLVGREEKQSEMAELTKVRVERLFASRRKTVAELYNDKAVFVIEGVETRTIAKQDILFLNMVTSVYTVGYTTRTTLWYDLVYKLSPSTYTFIHFGYDMAVTETFFDCEAYKSIQSWATNIGIRTTDTKYDKVNPFVNGFNGMTYVDTQPAMAKVSGCYVATCVYGSYDCPQVWTLRRYRDYYLDERWWGRAFIKVYYAISPKLIKIFGKTRWFKKINKAILDKKVKKLLDKGYQDTAYIDKY